MLQFVAGQMLMSCIFSFLHPTCPLDLLTCHPQTHLAAFRQPTHPHFNLCLPLCSCLRGSERVAFCVHALDVMDGKWWMESVRPPPAATGRGRHPSGNGCYEDVYADIGHKNQLLHCFALLFDVKTCIQCRQQGYKKNGGGYKLQ